MNSSKHFQWISNWTFNASLSVLCHRIYPFTYWYALVYTQFHVNQTKGERRKRQRIRSKKASSTWKMASDIYYEFPESFFSIRRLSCSIYYSFPLCFVFLFCISLNRAKAFHSTSNSIFWIRYRSERIFKWYTEGKVGRIERPNGKKSIFMMKNFDTFGNESEWERIQEQERVSRMCGAKRFAYTNDERQ